MAPTLRSAMFVVLALLCLSLLAGCDVAQSMAESAKHEGPIAQEIENAVGKRPVVVSVHSVGYLVVNVQFTDVPSVPVSTIEAIARAAVVHEFEAEPEMLTIGFVYQKLPK